MTILHAGYYSTGLSASYDWHAGVRMKEEYVSYLKFLPELRWISTNWYPAYAGSNFDFPQFLTTLDIPRIFASRESPPTCEKRDHNFMYHRGEYCIQDSCIKLSWSFLNIGATADDDIASFEQDLISSEDGRSLIDPSGTTYTYHDSEQVAGHQDLTHPVSKSQ